MTARTLSKKLREALAGAIIVIVCLVMAAGTFWLERATNWNLFYKKKAGEQVEQLQVEIDHLKVRLEKLEAARSETPAQ